MKTKISKHIRIHGKAFYFFPDLLKIKNKNITDKL